MSLESAERAHGLRCPVSYRWASRAVGVLVLAPLAAASSGAGVLAALPLAALTAGLGSLCVSDIHALVKIHPPRKSLKGRRTRNLRSLADFMRLWMYFLCQMVAVAVCARALSATVDVATGGRLRRWLFGYESKALGEPWPDVLGVTIVIVLCFMFMCGLEYSTPLTIILGTDVALIILFFILVGLLNIDWPAWYSQSYFPTNWFDLVATAASCSYAFPLIFTSNSVSNKLDSSILTFFMMVGMGIAFCLMIGYRELSDTVLPIIRILQVLNLTWPRPIMASLTLIGISLAMTEICPKLFNVLVTLASSEWRVLTRSLTYESSTTGSPVLAVFTAGSLSAILAFACPLSHMITLLNAGPLFMIVIQALMIMNLRCQPSEDQVDDPGVQYRRLGQNKISKGISVSKSTKPKPGLWFLPASLRQNKDNMKPKSRKKDSDEKECLLLDEYSADPSEGGSGLTASMGDNLLHVDSDPSDAEHSINSSDGESSTDIDAVVKEYQDRIKVVTAIPESSRSTTSIPSAAGGRHAAIGAAVVVLGSVLTSIALCMELSGLFYGGLIIAITGGIIAGAQSAHGTSPWVVVRAPASLVLAMLLLTPLLLVAWPAVLLFTGAGLVMYARCEKWCGELPLKKKNVKHCKLRPASLTTGLDLTHVDTVYITR